MAVRKCEVCGCCFNTNHNLKKTCSDDCSKEWVRIKKRKSRNPPVRLQKKCVVCFTEFTPSTNNNQVICSSVCEKNRRAEKARIYRSKNPQYWNKYYEDNKENVDARKNQYRKENPKPQVRSSIKAQLGEEPPEELVEEATMLRLLRRAIRN